MGKRSNLALLFGLAAFAAFSFAGYLVLQPGPTDFAGGKTVSLDQYKGASPTGVPPELASADLVKRGEYLARAADCAACHTRAGGQAYAGGRAFDLPFGTIYTPNITSDKETGIGAWSDAQFLRAVHDGVGRSGERLYPAFPYPSYAMLTDDDVLAIKAYLLSLPPVRRENRPNTFVFPFNQRPLMAVWSTFFNRAGIFRPRSDRSAEWNRGAYLVEAAGHCGECHTPRNLMQAMNTRRKFAGGEAENWKAYNITSDGSTGIGSWTDDELVEYLSKGFSPGRGAASGPMAEVVELSTSKLSPADVRAIVTYLRSIAGIHDRSLSPTITASVSPNPKTITDQAIGLRVFQGACASCHAWDGSARLTPEAELIGARALRDPSGVNVALTILHGTGPRESSRPFMPSFGAYNDAEIAAVTNYVTSRFGSAPSSLAAGNVARLRAKN